MAASLVFLNLTRKTRERLSCITLLHKQPYFNSLSRGSVWICLCFTPTGISTVMKQQEVFLALASLLPLVVVLVKCICCRQKSKIIKEENTVYEEHLSEHRGFTVVRSKTVTRPNQMTRETPPSPSQPASASELHNGGDEQPKYENIVIVVNDANAVSEPTYVAPIATSPYENDDDSTSYENVFACNTLHRASSLESVESQDYENAGYLGALAKEKEKHETPLDYEESDYINTSPIAEKAQAIPAHLERAPELKPSYRK
ncbi:LAT2 domain-containing protein isoform X2 [Polyodon spathula]|uniref:LAT2 domain-containing protein isoform X2 n=1 Tax=Polyodon spathula TaxID=7913 RepID=UPI001B7E940C|nr:LAT2 domain-containing protein isoform X2 [Polyodon spathula]